MDSVPHSGLRDALNRRLGAREAARSRRISFVERACQGKLADKSSLKPTIFAMLRSVEHAAVFSIQRGDHVDAKQAVEAESGRHRRWAIGDIGSREHRRIA